MESILSYSPSEEDDYYTVLGCTELSSTEQVMAEYKQRAKLCHPDKTPQDSQAAMKFQRLHKAKAILSDSQSRKNYDLWRRSGVCISYDKWCALSATHSSMHWAPRKVMDKMLEDIPLDSNEVEGEFPSDVCTKAVCDSMETIRARFRNYEI